MGNEKENPISFKDHISGSVPIFSDETHSGNTLPNKTPDETHDKKSDETLLQELLQAAQDVSVLEGKELAERLKIILDRRIKTELMIAQLLAVGVEHDKIDVESAAAINNKSKDSIAELIKVYRLLLDLSTENINLYTPEEAEELKGLREGIYGRG